MTGLNEIALPSVEPGSSIMPGKVNPSIIESVNMVCLQVIGVRESVANAVRFGSLDLNVYLPLIAFNADNSLHWLTAAVKNLNDKCITGISAEKETLSHYYLYSNAFVTAISPIIGYDKAAELAREAGAQGKTVAELLVERKMLSLKELQELEKVVTGPDIEFIEKMRRMHEKASRKSGAMS
jgi:aspartate ammonia-lyase